MKAISINLEEVLLQELNGRAKSLQMTRAELIRNAIMEYLFRFDDKQDAQMLADAVANDPKARPLAAIARELGLES